ncbi:hypothetical protein FNF29_03651 [Cafeteria roenbergensis]|uniref:Uncharacterized protein n=3 Tax=Cafeteria roenbergensis TaxID=33653 RepID=A0A5A8CJT5_CAFRO|nr:hypothetical protein FNF29_03651 [Cafeteria roenbergensis]|eukprot:KAA0152764.1 hypothetical protein FNF29_03651 [Cafeteria roenbergensis]
MSRWQASASHVRAGTAGSALSVRSGGDHSGRHSSSRRGNTSVRSESGASLSSELVPRGSIAAPEVSALLVSLGQAAARGSGLQLPRLAAGTGAHAGAGADGGRAAELPAEITALDGEGAQMQTFGSLAVSLTSLSAGLTRKVSAWQLFGPGAEGALREAIVAEAIAAKGTHAAAAAQAGPGTAAAVAGVGVGTKGTSAAERLGLRLHQPAMWRGLEAEANAASVAGLLDSPAVARRTATAGEGPGAARAGGRSALSNASPVPGARGPRGAVGSLGSPTFGRPVEVGSAGRHGKGFGQSAWALRSSLAAGAAASPARLALLVTDAPSAAPGAADFARRFDGFVSGGNAGTPSQRASPMFSTPVRGPGSFGMQSPVPGPGGSGGKGDGSGGPRGGWYGFGGSIPAFASPLSTLSDADGKYDRGLGPLGSGGRRAARRRRAEGEQAGSLRGQFASRHQTQALAGHQAAPGLHGVPGVFRPLRSQVADSLHRAALQQPPPRISAPTGSATVQPGAAGHASATTSGAPAASAGQTAGGGGDAAHLAGGDHEDWLMTSSSILLFPGLELHAGRVRGLGNLLARPGGQPATQSKLHGDARAPVLRPNRSRRAGPGAQRGGRASGPSGTGARGGGRGGYPGKYADQGDDDFDESDGEGDDVNASDDSEDDDDDDDDDDDEDEMGEARGVLAAVLASAPQLHMDATVINHLAGLQAAVQAAGGIRISSSPGPGAVAGRRGLSGRAGTLFSGTSAARDEAASAATGGGGVSNASGQRSDTGTPAEDIASQPADGAGAAAPALGHGSEADDAASRGVRVAGAAEVLGDGASGLEGLGLTSAPAASRDGGDRAAAAAGAEDAAKAAAARRDAIAKAIPPVTLLLHLNTGACTLWPAVSNEAVLPWQATVAAVLASMQDGRGGRVVHFLGGAARGGANGGDGQLPLRWGAAQDDEGGAQGAARRLFSSPRAAASPLASDALASPGAWPAGFGRAASASDAGQEPAESVRHATSLFSLSLPRVGGVATVNGGCSRTLETLGAASDVPQRSEEELSALELAEARPGQQSGAASPRRGNERGAQPPSSQDIDELVDAQPVAEWGGSDGGSSAGSARRGSSAAAAPRPWIALGVDVTLFPLRLSPQAAVFASQLAEELDKVTHAGVAALHRNREWMVADSAALGAGLLTLDGQRAAAEAGAAAEAAGGLLAVGGEAPFRGRGGSDSEDDDSEGGGIDNLMRSGFVPDANARRMAARLAQSQPLTPAGAGAGPGEGGASRGAAGGGDAARGSRPRGHSRDSDGLGDGAADLGRGAFGVGARHGARGRPGEGFGAGYDDNDDDEYDGEGDADFGDDAFDDADAEALEPQQLLPIEEWIAGAGAFGADVGTVISSLLPPAPGGMSVDFLDVDLHATVRSVSVALFDEAAAGVGARLGAAASALAASASRAAEREGPWSPTGPGGWSGLGEAEQPAGGLHDRSAPARVLVTCEPLVPLARVSAEFSRPMRLAARWRPGGDSLSIRQLAVASGVQLAEPRAGARLVRAGSRWGGAPPLTRAGSWTSPRDSSPWMRRVDSAGKYGRAGAGSGEEHSSAGPVAPRPPSSDAGAAALVAVQEARSLRATEAAMAVARVRSAAAAARRRQQRGAAPLHGAGGRGMDAASLAEEDALVESTMASSETAEWEATVPVWELAVEVPSLSLGFLCDEEAQGDDAEGGRPDEGDVFAALEAASASRGADRSGRGGPADGRAKARAGASPGGAAHGAPGAGRPGLGGRASSSGADKAAGLGWTVSGGPRVDEEAASEIAGIVLTQARVLLRRRLPLSAVLERADVTGAPAGVIQSILDASSSHRESAAAAAASSGHDEDDHAAGASKSAAVAAPVAAALMDARASVGRISITADLGELHGGGGEAMDGNLTGADRRRPGGAGGGGAAGGSGAGEPGSGGSSVAAGHSGRREGRRGRATGLETALTFRYGWAVSVLDAAEAVRRTLALAEKTSASTGADDSALGIDASGLPEDAGATDDAAEAAAEAEAGRYGGAAGWTGAGVRPQPDQAPAGHMHRQASLGAELGAVSVDEGETDVISQANSRGAARKQGLPRGMARSEAGASGAGGRRAGAASSASLSAIAVERRRVRFRLGGVGVSIAAGPLAPGAELSVALESLDAAADDTAPVQPGRPRVDPATLGVSVGPLTVRSTGALDMALSAGSRAVSGQRGPRGGGQRKWTDGAAAAQSAGGSVPSLTFSLFVAYGTPLWSPKPALQAWTATLGPVSATAVNRPRGSPDTDALWLSMPPPQQQQQQQLRFAARLRCVERLLPPRTGVPLVALEESARAAAAAAEAAAAAPGWYNRRQRRLQRAAGAGRRAAGDGGGGAAGSSSVGDGGGGHGAAASSTSGGGVGGSSVARGDASLFGDWDARRDEEAAIDAAADEDGGFDWVDDDDDRRALRVQQAAVAAHHARFEAQQVCAQARADALVDSAVTLEVPGIALHADDIVAPAHVVSTAIAAFAVADSRARDAVREAARRIREEQALRAAKERKAEERARPGTITLHLGACEADVFVTPAQSARLEARSLRLTLWQGSGSHGGRGWAPWDHPGVADDGAFVLPRAELVRGRDGEALPPLGPDSSLVVRRELAASLLMIRMSTQHWRVDPAAPATQEEQRRAAQPRMALVRSALGMGGQLPRVQLIPPGAGSGPGRSPPAVSLRLSTVQRALTPTVLSPHVVYAFKSDFGAEVGTAQPRVLISFLFDPAHSESPGVVVAFRERLERAMAAASSAYGPEGGATPQRASGAADAPAAPPSAPGGDSLVLTRDEAATFAFSPSFSWVSGELHQLRLALDNIVRTSAGSSERMLQLKRAVDALDREVPVALFHAVAAPLAGALSGARGTLRLVDDAAGVAAAAAAARQRATLLQHATEAAIAEGASFLDSLAEHVAERQEAVRAEEDARLRAEAQAAADALAERRRHEQAELALAEERAREEEEAAMQEARWREQAAWEAERSAWAQRQQAQHYHGRADERHVDPRLRHARQRERRDEFLEERWVDGEADWDRSPADDGRFDRPRALGREFSALPPELEQRFGLRREGREGQPDRPRQSRRHARARGHDPPSGWGGEPGAPAGRRRQRDAVSTASDPRASAFDDDLFSKYA